MRNPFIITFKKKVNTSGRSILQEFEDSLDKVDCLKCKMLRTGELRVSNEFICIPRDWLPNAWMGVAEVRISKHDSDKPNYQIIRYSIDDSWGILWSLFIIIMFSTLVLTSADPGLKPDYSLIALPILILAISFGIGIQLWMQWIVFNRIVKYGSTKATLGDYNWLRIMRRKSDDELKLIIDGKRQLPQAVINIAKEELEKRSNKSKR